MPKSEYSALQLEGGEVTFLEKAEGGWISAEVARGGRGSQGYIKKRIGKLQYGEIVIHTGWALSQALFEWIGASWQPQAPRLDGAILACDANFAIKSERRFTQALIQEVAFPALDGSSKEPGYLSVRLAPQSITTKKGAGESLLSKLGKHKLWRTSNFRLEIDGLESAHVRRIEPFAIKRAPGSKAEKVDFPDLSISLSETGAQSWIDWHEDFVIKGYSDDRHEKEGAILFLAQDQKTELARLELHQLGIFRLAEENREEDKPNLLRAELYCEWMEFHLGRVKS